MQQSPGWRFIRLETRKLEAASSLYSELYHNEFQYRVINLGVRRCVVNHKIDTCNEDEVKILRHKKLGYL